VTEPDRSGSAPSVTVSRDPSLSLLLQIMDTAVDPDYAASSARTVGHRGRLGGRGVLVAVGIVVLGIGLGAAAAAVRSTTVPEARQARDVLLARVATDTTATDALEETVARLQRDVDALTRGSGAAPAGSSAVAAAAAATPLSGSGLRVTLDDAPAETARDGSTDAGRVLDRDVQTAVNGLWAAGAEGVAINGQRLTATSAIRTAGDAILVDYRPLAPPYVIEAVGAADQLSAGFASSAAAGSLATLVDTYGIRFDVERVTPLALPAGSVTALRVATPAPVSGQEEAP
jgi:uncharacterized protein YlxW (UPF0749 family)